MNTKEAYQQKMKAKLEQLNAEIAKLEAKKDELEADAYLKLVTTLDDLKTQRDQLQQKLDSLAHTSKEAWEDIKTGFDLAADVLGDAISSALSRFKK